MQVGMGFRTYSSGSRMHLSLSCIIYSGHADGECYNAFMPGHLPTGVIEKLDSVTFDDFLATQVFDEEENCVFDLSGARMITSAAMTQLAAACYHAFLEGRRPVVAVDDVGVRSYLLRSRFVDLLEGIAEFRPQFLTGIFGRSEAPWVESDAD